MCSVSVWSVINLGVASVWIWSVSVVIVIPKVTLSMCHFPSIPLWCIAMSYCHVLLPHDSWGREWKNVLKSLLPLRWIYLISLCYFFLPCFWRLGELQYRLKHGYQIIDDSHLNTGNFSPLALPPVAITPRDTCASPSSFPPSFCPNHCLGLGSSAFEVADAEWRFCACWIYCGLQHIHYKSFKNGEEILRRPSSSQPVPLCFKPGLAASHVISKLCISSSPNCSVWCAIILFITS